MDDAPPKGTQPPLIVELQPRPGTLLGRCLQLFESPGQRAVLRLEQKAIIDRVKISAYNAEEWLLELLVRHYPNP